MIVYINGTVIPFDFCSVVLNRYSFTQRFEIQCVTQEDNLYAMHDPVLITHANGKTIIEGEIEYIKTSDALRIYKGRNVMKKLVDSNFPETRQFSASSKIRNILQDVCNPYSVDVIGNTNSLSKSNLICRVGDNVSEKIKDICVYGGVDISFDVDNVIYLNRESEGMNKDFEFVYGGTVLEREYLQNVSDSFDKYSVYSLYNNASYGSGKEKIIRYDIDLSQADCFRIAYNMHSKDKRDNFTYSCLIPGDNYVIFNDIYHVEDSILKIDSRMRLKSVVHEQSFDKYSARCVLENVN